MPLKKLEAPERIKILKSLLVIPPGDCMYSMGLVTYRFNLHI